MILPPAWVKLLAGDPVLDSLPYLYERVEQDSAGSVPVYPPTEQRFRALQELNPQDVRVVILGQDPYHGPGQACGLAFAVPRGHKIPPSLRNLYRELSESMGISIPEHGDLSPWSQQGVLLLNAVLSVREAQAGSHAGWGWEDLTDALLAALARHKPGIVFMLWGAFARSKAPLLHNLGHLVLEAPHPSPLSAHRGFLGCGHFVQAQNWWLSRNEKPVDWSLV
jgi:uracil-DNA glycosylase